MRSADTEVEVRFWATYLLGELNYADAAGVLLPRLFDENMAVRRIAVRSARSLVAAGDEALPLRRNLERMIAYPDDLRRAGSSRSGRCRRAQALPLDSEPHRRSFRSARLHRRRRGASPFGDDATRVRPRRPQVERVVGHQGSKKVSVSDHFRSVPGHSEVPGRLCP